MIDFASPDVFLPPVFAFGACVLSGVTNFGDGVFFIICWDLYGQYGTGDGDYSYAKAILYSTLLPLASIPALVYAAWIEMRITMVYGNLLSFTSALSTVLGVWVLLFVNARIVTMIAGSIFFAFTLFKLIPATYELGVKKVENRKAERLKREKLDDHGTSVGERGGDAVVNSTGNPLAHLPSEHVSVDMDDYVRNDVTLDGYSKSFGSDDETDSNDDDDSNDDERRLSSSRVEKVELDATETIVIDQRRMLHWLSMEEWFQAELGGKSNRRRRLESFFPQISESHIAVETVAFWLFICGIGSGFLGGVIGTGSPAQLIAFSQLDLTKGAMRGVKVQATIVSNLIRLLAIIIFGGSEIFIFKEWPVYLTVCITALLGATFGTWLRLYVNKDFLLIMLYWLLWFTSADLVGVFKVEATQLAAIVFYCGTLLLMFTTYLCYYSPGSVSKLYKRAFARKEEESTEQLEMVVRSGTPQYEQHVRASDI